MHSTPKYTNSLYSPSFNRYFNTNLAEIAARTTAEVSDANASDDFAVSHNIHHEVRGDNGGYPEIGCQEESDSDEFEFDLSNLKNGEVPTVYPLFDRDLLRDFHLVGEIDSQPPNRPSSPSSSASSEADEPEEISPERYCFAVAREVYKEQLHRIVGGGGGEDEEVEADELSEEEQERPERRCDAVGAQEEGGGAGRERE